MFFMIIFTKTIDFIFYFRKFVLHELQKLRRNKMKDEKRKSIKPRSIRFTDEQEQVFAMFEERGINISHLIRKVADIVIKENKFIVAEQKTN